MIIRAIKDKANPYVMMNKGFLQDPALSSKAKGLMAYILSLPDDWKIYIEELTAHFRDGRTAIAGAIRELIAQGYCHRWQEKSTEGKFLHYNYDIHENKPQAGFPLAGKPKADNPNTGNLHLLSKEILNNEQLNNEKRIRVGRMSGHSSKFEKPTLEAVKEYIREKRITTVDPEHFWNYYESNGWKVGRNPMKNWKACVSTWVKNETRFKTPDSQMKNAPAPGKYDRFSGRTPA